MWVVFGLSYEKTLHSKLELRNRLKSSFVSPIVEEDFPRSAPTKGKRNNMFQVYEKSEDNDIVNDQPTSKKNLKFPNLQLHQLRTLLLLSFYIILL